MKNFHPCRAIKVWDWKTYTDERNLLHVSFIHPYGRVPVLSSSFFPLGYAGFQGTSSAKHQGLEEGTMEKRADSWKEVCLSSQWAQLQLI